MTDKTKTTLQIVFVVVLVVALLIWWGLYRVGVFRGPSQSQQNQVMQNLDKNNNDFLKLLEDNAKFLSSSTPSTVPPVNQATSTTAQ